MLQFAECEVGRRRDGEAIYRLRLGRGLNLTFDNSGVLSEGSIYDVLESLDEEESGLFAGGIASVLTLVRHKEGKHKCFVLICLSLRSFSLCNCLILKRTDIEEIGRNNEFLFT